MLLANFKSLNKALVQAIYYGEQKVFSARQNNIEKKENENIASKHAKTKNNKKESFKMLDWVLFE